MYIFLSIVVVSIYCTVIIKIFTKDNKHDLNIKIGGFMFSMIKHDKEQFEIIEHNTNN